MGLGLGLGLGCLWGNGDVPLQGQVEAVHGVLHEPRQVPGAEVVGDWWWDWWVWVDGWVKWSTHRWRGVGWVTIDQLTAAYIHNTIHHARIRSPKCAMTGLSFSVAPAASWLSAWRSVGQARSSFQKGSPKGT